MFLAPMVFPRGHKATKTERSQTYFSITAHRHVGKYYHLVISITVDYTQMYI